MSGHETIRVLEVEVDSSLTSSDRKALAEVEEGGKLTSEGRAQSSPTEANKTKTGGEVLTVKAFKCLKSYSLQSIWSTVLSS